MAASMVDLPVFGDRLIDLLGRVIGEEIQKEVGEVESDITAEELLGDVGVVGRS